jgi:hypothetical protein
LSVSGPEDVQEAFLFAKKTGIHLSIKASGHDYKGRSGSKGSLNIWASHFQIPVADDMLTASSDPKFG